MLAGDTAEDERGGSHNSESTYMTELPDSIGRVIRDGLSTMERKLVLNSEEKLAKVTEQQAELQNNMEKIVKKQERMDKKLDTVLDNLPRPATPRKLVLNSEEKLAKVTEQQAELQNNMEKIVKKQERMEKKLDTVLDYLHCQATLAASSLSSDCIEPRQQCHQEFSPGNESSTGWQQYAQSLLSFMGSLGMPSQGGSSENLAMFTQPPPSVTLTRSACVVSTIANNIQMVLNQQNLPSTQLPNDNTIPTFMCQQPRTHTQSTSLMPSAFQRELVHQNGNSHGQNVPRSLSCDAVLALARQCYDQQIPSGNHHTRLMLQDINGNTVNTVIANVNNEGSEVAARTHSIVDPACSALELYQIPVFPDLPPPVLARRRGSGGGTVLTETVILRLSRTIGPKWKNIGIECLKFSSDFLGNIDRQNQDFESKIFEMFKAWKRQQGVGGGTVEKLAELLKLSHDIDPEIHDFMNSVIESSDSNE